MKVLGIDEAGRGPCIGPLVICAVLIDEKELDKLTRLKLKDSKLLTPKRRAEFFGKLKKVIKKYKVIVVPPQEIDKAVQGHDGLNLNWLEARKSAELINALKPDRVMLDCPSPNIKAYTSYLKKYLSNKDVIVKAEHKADLKYVIVSAASIIAKVIRDKEIKKIQEKIKESIGSGYPADPITQEFLKKNYKKYSNIFRHSWSCYKAIAEKKKQRKLGEF